MENSKNKFYTETSSLIIIKKIKKGKIKKKKSYFFNTIIFIDLYILLINIYYLFKKSDAIPKKLFRNVDNYIIEKDSKSYKEYSNYLNSKFYNNTSFSENNNINNQETKEKKKIVIYFADLYNRDFRQKWIKSELGDKFNIEFDSENPDYVIFNIFGCYHLDEKYKDAVKIAHFTENKIIDFREADYAIGQQHINYLDRYFRRPFFVFSLINNTNKDFQEIREQVLKNPIREKFCAAVISNSGWTDGFRRLFYKELNKYKEIDMGGYYHNNVGGPVRDKKKFLRKYKFSIAMENTKSDGYISEKIIDAFLAGNIPIYYGDYMVEEYINPKAFILIKGEKDMMEKIEYIKKIDNDDELYRSFLREKVLIDDKIKEESTNERIQFLTHIFEQDKSLAKRIDKYDWKRK